MARNEKTGKGKPAGKKDEFAEKADVEMSTKQTKKKFNFKNVESDKAEETKQRKSKRKLTKDKELNDSGKESPMVKDKNVEEVNSKKQKLVSSKEKEDGEATEPEELLDYEDSEQLPSNESNSAQKESNEDEAFSSSGSTVREKSPECETDTDSSRIVSLKNTPKKVKRSKLETKRKRRVVDDSSASSSSDESVSDNQGTRATKRRTHKKEKGENKRLKRVSKSKKKKKKKRRVASSSSGSDSSESTGEEEIRGLTEQKLKKMFASYYDTRKAEEQEDLMRAIPDTAGQLRLSRNLRNLTLNSGKSETTIYSKAINSQNSSPSEVQSQESGFQRKVGKEKSPSNSDNYPGAEIGIRNLSSSDDALEISPTGQRMLPKPPTMISDDIALAEAMNRPEWSQAIDRAREEADKIIREAEANKVRMVKPTGENFHDPLRSRDVIDTIKKHKDTDRCDEVERLISAHIDEGLKEKIQRGEFVELHKLVFKDKTSEAETNKMKLLTPMGTLTMSLLQMKITLALLITLGSGKRVSEFMLKFTLLQILQERATYCNIWMILKMLLTFMCGKTSRNMMSDFGE